MLERCSNIIVLLTSSLTGFLISPYTIQYQRMGMWHKMGLLRVRSRHLLVAVEPGTDDGRMTEHRQKTRTLASSVTDI